MKVAVVPIVFMFLASVLILPIGQSFASSNMTVSNMTMAGDNSINQTMVQPPVPTLYGATNQTTQSPGSVTGVVMAYKATASDGTQVILRAGHPISGQPLSLGIGFFNSVGNAIQHQNYAITITQDNVTVLTNPNGHTHTGTDTQITSALTSSNPVSIQMTLKGVGLPTTAPSTWTGAKGEVLIFGPSTEDVTPTTSEVTPVPSVNDTKEVQEISDFTHKAIADFKQQGIDTRKIMLDCRDKTQTASPSDIDQIKQECTMNLNAIKAKYQEERSQYHDLVKKYRSSVMVFVKDARGMQVTTSDMDAALANLSKMLHPVVMNGTVGPMTGLMAKTNNTHCVNVPGGPAIC